MAEEKQTQRKSGKTNRLGREFGALFSSASMTMENVETSVIRIKINDITPNSNQPRKNFDEEKLQELADSIRANGIIQPLIVQRDGNERIYTIVAGERRWRAARMAGLDEVPAIVRELSDKQVLQYALIENIQREDLNPIEEANALQELLQDHQMTQEELSEVIGRSRSAVANTMRLLNLPDDIQMLVVEGRISAGHGRALLALPAETMQRDLARRIEKEGLSVRETERKIRVLLQRKEKKEAESLHIDSAYLLSIKQVERDLTRVLGTRVRLQDTHGKGTILIKYNSNDDLQRILEQINATD